MSKRCLKTSIGSLSCQNLNAPAHYHVGWSMKDKRKETLSFKTVVVIAILLAREAGSIVTTSPLLIARTNRLSSLFALSNDTAGGFYLVKLSQGVVDLHTDGYNIG